VTDEKHLIYHLNKLGYKSYREYLVSDHYRLVLEDLERKLSIDD